MTPHYKGQSAINKNAADGGYWHQSALIDALNQWRTHPLGASLALRLFGSLLYKAQSCRAYPMKDPSAKPDLEVILIDDQGLSHQCFISAKLARIGSTDDSARPMHHASRVKFEEAHLHGLLPEKDLTVRSLILSHFIDGESLSRLPQEESSQALLFFQESWPWIARAALEGLSTPKATHLVISLAEQDHCKLILKETRCLTMDEALHCIEQEPPQWSKPKDNQLGTIGQSWMHLQRGQALSYGHQKDIQIKINAGALFRSAAPLTLKL